MRTRFLLALGVASSPLAAQEISGHQTPFGPGAGALGGAFTAVADDPTAMIYNPAGIALIQTDKRSLSYNSYMTAKYSIGRIIFDADYEASMTNTPFFVGTTYRGADWGAWTIAVATYDRSNYNNRVRWDAAGKQKVSIGENAAEVDGRYESVSRQSGSELTGAVAGARTTAFGAIGFTLAGQYLRSSRQDYSESKFGPFDFPSIQGKDLVSTNVSNTDSEAKGVALEFALGGMWHVAPDWSLGVSLSRATIFKQEEIVEVNAHYYHTKSDGSGATIVVDGVERAMAPSTERATEREDRPFGSPPLFYRLGVAHKVGDVSRWSADLIGRGKGQMSGNLVVYPGIDGAVGFETRFAPTVIWRVGAYTAWDPSNVLSRDGVRRQEDYVDSLGATLGLTYLASGWSLGGGAMYQRGRGRSVSGAEDAEAAPIKLNLTTLSAFFVSDQ